MLLVRTHFDVNYHGFSQKRETKDKYFAITAWIIEERKIVWNIIRYRNQNEV